MSIKKIDLVYVAFYDHQALKKSLISIKDFFLNSEIYCEYSDF